MRRATQIAIILIFFIVLMAFLVEYVKNFLVVIIDALLHSNQTEIGSVSLLASLKENAVFYYNNSHSLIVYSLLSYNLTNATNASISLNVYAKNPFQRIYLVNVSSFCLSCFDENILRGALQSYLSQYDLLRNGSSFNYIPLADVAAIPPGSIVIIPSGMLPASMLNKDNSSIFNLLGEGDTVVYVGLNFNKSIGPGGLIFVNSPAVMSNLYQNGLDTIPISNFIGTPTSGPRANLSFNKPTFAFTGGRIYENVSYINSGNGTMIAFSNYAKSSWVSAIGMANDIAKAINARFWIQTLGNFQGNLTLSPKPSGDIGIFANTSIKASINNTYSLITISAKNKKGSSVLELSWKNFFKTKGLLGIPSPLGESYNIPILIQVNNSNSSINFHLDIYNRNMSYVGAIPIGFVSSAFGIVKYFAFTFPSGYYVISLRDFNENDYASSFFYLANTTITPTLLDFHNGTFAFSVYSNGFAVTNTTSTVMINGAYETQERINSGVLIYTLPQGTIIGYGNENFHFRMFNMNYTVEEMYEPHYINIPSIYIEFAVAIIVVVLLNLVLKPPNRDDYYIDVPEFPPSVKEKIKVHTSAVLGVFDKVNYYYHWKYMPLTVDEIKIGIGNNIRVNNLPISITMQNTNLLLFTLLEEGDVENSLTYYAPKTWVESSGHDIEYLTIFRKLRDYCVQHAMLFTDLNASSSADMIITKNTKQTSIFIYTATSAMKKMTLSNESRVAIVFLNEETMKAFLDKLYASFGKEAEILKLGVEYNYVRLLDTDHLDQL
ncbi:MAG: hypothetical protein ABSD68_02435 [Candidatus Micrarchaeales archaeon]|jgi:hypothetical protein